MSKSLFIQANNRGIKYLTILPYELCSWDWTLMNIAIIIEVGSSIFEW